MRNSFFCQRFEPPQLGSAAKVFEGAFVSSDIDTALTKDYIPSTSSPALMTWRNDPAAAPLFGAGQVERREAQRPRGGLRSPIDCVTRAPRETDSHSVLVTARGRTLARFVEGCLASTLAPPGAPFSLQRETENGTGSSAPSGEADASAQL